MSQLRRRRREQPRQRHDIAPEVPLPSADEIDGSEGESVQVIWGPMVDDFDVADLTVRDVYQLLQAPYHIAPGVTANVNGAEVAPDTRLARGDVLEFVRAAGEKGAR